MSASCYEGAAIWVFQFFWHIPIPSLFADIITSITSGGFYIALGIHDVTCHLFR